MKTKAGAALDAAVNIGVPADAISVDASTQAAADAYDSVPYQSKPFAQTTPEQLAIMATLFGLQPPALATARVLELGCSSGGNLIPLAVRYPGMRCVGVDISKVQVAQGEALLRQLALDNCTLMALDILRAASALPGPFDYIICHGVFSWVPDAVSDAILDLVRDRLAPDGVAYISYNVYPGWKMREVVREMMLFHAGGIEEPGQRLQQARAMVDFTTRISPEQTTYGKLLRDETQIVGRADDYYVLHEYLELNNKPVYFREFAARAAARRLNYLGEALLHEMAPQRLGPEVAQTLDRLSQGNILATEQYMDFFTNRTFRQTLLVHEAQVGRINRALDAAVMEKFAFSTAMSADAGFAAVPGQSPLAQYHDAQGRSLAAHSALSMALVNALIDAKPYPLAFASLQQQVMQALGTAPTQGATIARLMGTELLNLLVQNVVRLHAAELPKHADGRLRAFSLARVQASLGAPWVTNLLHQPTALGPAHRVVLRLLDGSRDKPALVRAVAAEFENGSLLAQRDGQRITDPSAYLALAEQFSDQLLRDFTAAALLE